MRRGLASEIFPMRLSGRPQDPDVRFCAPMAASAEARSAPAGGHPGRRVRRCGTWMQSLRRGCAADKGFPLAAGRCPAGCDKSRREAILPALFGSTERHGSRRHDRCPRGGHGVDRRPGRTQWPSRDGAGGPRPLGG